MMPAALILSIALMLVVKPSLSQTTVVKNKSIWSLPRIKFSFSSM